MRTTDKVREKILKLLRGGDSIREIARKLSLSKSTVHYQLRTGVWAMQYCQEICICLRRNKALAASKGGCKLAEIKRGRALQGKTTEN